MKIEWIIICVLAGYLIGSISFARIVARIFLPGGKVKSFRQPIPNTDKFFESDLVSATTVAVTAGKKYGCLISLLDMLKVGIPTLALRLIFKEENYHVLFAIMGLIGHNYPVYYRFTGGRGESVIIGASAVINLPALLLAHLSAVVAGFIAGSVLVWRWGGLALMILWVWILSKDLWQVVFATTGCVLYFLSMKNDLKTYSDLRKEGYKPLQEDISEFIVMGRSSGRILDRYGLPQMIKRVLKGKTGA